MAAERDKSAREIAGQVLQQYDPRRDYAGPILDKFLAQTTQTQRATDLVFGSIRNRAAIDTVITVFSGRPAQQIPAELLSILRVAVFELVYCPDTPEYSIVNEAVEQAKRIGGRKQFGFVNAVLREITRGIAQRQIELSKADAAKTLPQTVNTGCEFDRRFLPDAETATADYLAAAFSLTGWLVHRWLEDYGKEAARQICFAGNRRPSTYIRPNPLKTTTRELAELLRQDGIELEIASEQEMIKLKGAHSPGQLPGFDQGLFTVQDMAAAQAVRMLKPQRGWRILDMCAAPGTKTTQLAEATGDSAQVLATDIDEQRLQKGKENVARLGIYSVEIIPDQQIEQKTRDTGLFDAVLLDVPCSNTGVLARRPEVRWRIKRTTPMKLAAIQAKLLTKAVGLVKPGGKICYSTCSLQKEENDRLIEQFLGESAGFKLEREQLFLPCAEQFDHDGGYVAIIANAQA
jgi:16S rRNA (cytosine967-C5)-methyltransferase